MSHIKIDQHKQDRVMRSLNKDEIFSVKRCYEKLREKEVQHDMVEEKKWVIRRIWKISAPSKLKVFS